MMQDIFGNILDIANRRGHLGVVNQVDGLLDTADVVPACV